MIQTEERDYARDPANHALINVNAAALEERRVRRANTQRIEKLEGEVAEIKSMTQAILSLIKETRS